VYPDVPDWVVGDPDRIRQILLNFLSNALKFTDAGGGIIVQVQMQSRTDTDCLIKFSVADSGIGIPEDKQKKIFEAFSQADSTTSRQFGGTGLGLAISARLAQLMGGTIELESQVGRGSVFSFSVRLGVGVQPQQQGDAVSWPKAERQNRRREVKVLLAEDNRVNQKVAQRTLEKVGFQVTIANNGLDAVTCCELTEFDIVLMDIQMPGMDGLQAAQKIRAIPNRPYVPILAMTANTVSELDPDYKSAGMDGFVRKPFKREDLLATMETFIAKKID
jgi:CheY-like chemotaxis protein